MFQELQSYYQGFYLTEPVGNNAFSFESRRQKRIYVPPLISGDLDDVSIGTEVVFSEIREGREQDCVGLKHFVHWRWQDKDVFIFDNHQHAFVFWAFALKQKIFDPTASLMHVDQHKDVRKPEQYLEKEFWLARCMREIGCYAQEHLNVGNFLDSAIRAGMFKDVHFIDHEQAFDRQIATPCVADIDLDIFAPEMDYIDWNKKMEFIRRLLDTSCFITIATSPYFLDQDHAINLLKEMFDFSH